MFEIFDKLQKRIKYDSISESKSLLFLLSIFRLNVVAYKACGKAQKALEYKIKSFFICMKLHSISKSKSFII